MFSIVVKIEKFEGIVKLLRETAIEKKKHERLIG